MKKVSFDTISALTVANGFSGRGPNVPPTPEKMIEDIRAALKNRAAALSKQAADAKAAETDPTAPPSPFEISYHKSVQNIATFEKIVKDVPKGFRLTPVLYSKIDKEQNAHVYAEFSRHVRHPFLKYVATHHANELTALGISPAGIEAMKKGLDPVNENGMTYEVNIDHIVERSGGGKMSLQRAADPLLGGGSTFLVNHFANLILLPEHVHETKNKLNDLQQAALTKHHESAWVLMLIPEVDAQHSGFVAQPQDPGHYLHGLTLHKQDLSRMINRASFVGEQLQATIGELRVSPAIEKVLNMAESQSKKTSLKDAFNEAVGKSPKQKVLLENTLRPMIADAEKQIRDAFNEAFLNSPANDQGMRGFLPFYEGRKMATLRKAVDVLPVPEAAQLHDTLALIDQKIKQRKKNAPGR